MTIPSVGVSIPAYNDPDSLTRCLRSIAEVSPALLKSAVVIDDSGDGRVERQVREIAPAVQWKVHARNHGFGPSATEAVLENPADVVILLNDDVQLLTDPLPEIQRVFRDDRLFAVTFQSLNERDEFREGAKRLVWRWGLPRILHNPGDQLPAADGDVPSAYAVGGHAAFDRRKFADLGGFDPLFEPFYWEDVDLAERARWRGWACRFLPACQVRHAGKSAIRSSNSGERIRLITQRNRLLFAFRHAPPAQQRLRALSEGWHSLSSAIRRDRIWPQAHREAVARWKHLGALRPLETRGSTDSTQGAALGR